MATAEYRVQQCSNYHLCATTLVTINRVHSDPDGHPTRLSGTMVTTHKEASNPNGHTSVHLVLRVTAKYCQDSEARCPLFPRTSLEIGKQVKLVSLGHPRQFPREIMAETKVAYPDFEVHLASKAVKERRFQCPNLLRSPPPFFQYTSGSGLGTPKPHPFEGNDENKHGRYVKNEGQRSLLRGNIDQGSQGNKELRATAFIEQKCKKITASLLIKDLKENTHCFFFYYRCFTTWALNKGAMKSQ